MVLSIRKYIYGILAEQINQFSRYFESFYLLDKLPWDDELLFNQVITKTKKLKMTVEELPELEEGQSDLLLINGNLNYSYNIQEYLESVYQKSSRSTRVICVVYNSYLSFLYKFLSRLGLRKGKIPSSFITQLDLENLFDLSKFQIVYESNMVIFPFELFGIGTLINKILSYIPIVNLFSLFTLVVLRPIKIAEKKSVSILIPARNEKGNIKNALERIPYLDGAKIEVIFVEGNSSDGTWEEIVKLSNDPKYIEKFSIQYMKQPGKGKYDAVKTGFDAAQNDILMILDADLTMPPELLPQFYNVYCEGKGDFINGSRLVYPMEGEAMRFLNLIGNKFFAKLLSFLLDFKLSDTLCGTKVLSRVNYQRVKEWRNDFGDFDPFGDFELLFSAAELKMGIINVPVRYRDRIYGSTQINRFRDGAILLKMSAIALFKIKLKKI